MTIIVKRGIGVYITPKQEHPTVRKKRKFLKCQECGTVIQPKDSRQRYCGSWRKKMGCSYKRHKEMKVFWRESHREYLRKKEQERRDKKKATLTNSIKQ